MRKIFVIIILACFIQGCFHFQETDKSHEPSNEGEHREEALEMEAIVASVNGELIEKETVKKFIDTSKRYGIKENKTSATEQIIDTMLLMEETSKRGINATTLETRKYLNRTLEEGMDENQLSKNLGDEYPDFLENQRRILKFKRLASDEKGGQVAVEEMDYFLDKLLVELRKEAYIEYY